MISSLKLRWPLDYLVVLQTNKKLVKFQKSCPINKKSPLCKGLHRLWCRRRESKGICQTLYVKDDRLLQCTYFSTISTYFKVQLAVIAAVIFVDRLLFF